MTAVTRLRTVSFVSLRFVSYCGFSNLSLLLSYQRSLHVMSRHHIWLRFLFSLSFFPHRVISICYYPDGTVTNQDVPCLPGDEASWCCGFGYACLSNKICMATNYTTGTDISTYVRGSCTDKSWRAANCPSFCVNSAAPASDDVSGGEGMALCPNTTNTYYCIDFNQDAVNCAKLENIAYQATGKNKKRRIDSFQELILVARHTVCSDDHRIWLFDHFNTLSYRHHHTGARERLNVCDANTLHFSHGGWIKRQRTQVRLILHRRNRWRDSRRRSRPSRHLRRRLLPLSAS